MPHINSETNPFHHYQCYLQVSVNVRERKPRQKKKTKNNWQSTIQFAIIWSIPIADFVPTLMGLCIVVIMLYIDKKKLKELCNCILRTILVWSLFYSIRVHTSVFSIYSFGKLVFLSFCSYVYHLF